MRTPLYISLALLALLGCSRRTAPVITTPSVTQIGVAQADSRIEAVFSELQALKPMQPGQTYTVRVAGARETGPKEQFLRRRTAAEISESGLSCGCGDYALLFIERIHSKGFQTLLVDGAEISYGSLQNHFSGHAVVAIRPQETETDTLWTLVDSTNLKILSPAWGPTAKSFEAFGSAFWIGYCGAAADYPVHGPEDLKAFYTKTLASVPREFLNQNLIRLKFTVDPSLIGKDGKFLNPRLSEFLHRQERIFAANDIAPEREVSVRLTRGENDARTSITCSESEGWVARFGLQSGGGPSLLSYFERAVLRRELQNPK
jgi:hypothetical protein